MKTLVNRLLLRARKPSPQEAAQTRLAAMVEARRSSPEILSYVKHRTAAIQGRGK